MIIKEFLWKFKYIIIIGILLLLLFIGYKKYNHIKQENQRATHNIENMNFQFETIKGKNGELHQAVKALTLKKDELEHFNYELSNTIDSMRIKQKHLESATKIRYNYNKSVKNKLSSKEVKTPILDNINKQKLIDIENKQIDDEYKKYLIDSLYRVILSNSKEKRYSVDYDNDNIQLKTVIVIPNDYLEGKFPYLDGIDYFYNDSLIIVGEKTYKRRWLFFKKLTGVKIHIKSNNPSFHLDKVETYKFE